MSHVPNFSQQQINSRLFRFIIMCMCVFGRYNSVVNTCVFFCKKNFFLIVCVSAFQNIFIFFGTRHGNLVLFFQHRNICKCMNSLRLDLWSGKHLSFNDLSQMTLIDFTLIVANTRFHVKRMNQYFSDATENFIRFFWDAYDTWEKYFLSLILITNYESQFSYHTEVKSADEYGRDGRKFMHK